MLTIFACLKKERKKENTGRAISTMFNQPAVLQDLCARKTWKEMEGVIRGSGVGEIPALEEKKNRVASLVFHLFGFLVQPFFARGAKTNS